MSITTQQLKEAYARTQGFTPKNTKEMNVFLLKEIAIYEQRVLEERAIYQKQLDSLPLDGKGMIKEIAIKQLAIEAEQQLRGNIKDINL